MPRSDANESTQAGKPNYMQWKSICCLLTAALFLLTCPSLGPALPQPSPSLPQPQKWDITPDCWLLGCGHAPPKSTAANNRRFRLTRSLNQPNKSAAGAPALAGWGMVVRGQGHAAPQLGDESCTACCALQGQPEGGGVPGPGLSCQPLTNNVERSRYHAPQHAVPLLLIKPKICTQKQHAQQAAVTGRMMSREVLLNRWDKERRDTVR